MLLINVFSLNYNMTDSLIDDCFHDNYKDYNLNTSRQIAGHMDERTTLNNYYFDRSDEAEKYDNFVRALA